MLIKLDDGSVNSMIEALRLHAFDDCGGKDLPTHICNIAADMMQALRALPVSDGWEDIATYEGLGDEYLQVWCECEDSGMRWTTVAYRTCYELWFNDLDGYVPAKGYRPLPAPPTIE